MKLHIYNPDTDFALAVGGEGASRPYTPPKDIREMRRRNALLPAVYAYEGDAVLCLDEPVVRGDNDLATRKRIEVITLRQLKAFAQAHPDARPEPWGWNPTIRRQLLNGGIDPALMPSEEEIETLRQFSHRRLTIPFNRFLADALVDCKEIDAAVPLELTDTGETDDFIAANPGGYLKAPWSSSGRGVMPIASCPKEIVRQWAIGTIRRQGSVLAETGVDRAVDFASEWTLEDGKARFLGLSLFRTSGRARYKGNELLPQHEIRRIAGGPVDRIIEAQRGFLEAEVASKWSGPAGIDMLRDSSGRIRPCIEVNLRRTMGHISLLLTSEDKDTQTPIQVN